MPPLFDKLKYLFFLAILCASCQNDPSPIHANGSFDLPDLVDYNFHVRPILSDKCFACHGPDMDSQKGDLRLDQPDAAYQPLVNSRGHAIVPGKPQKSQAYLRMITDDPEQIMPPPESHLSLTDEEIALIAKWIEQGAEYKPHWAFVKPKIVEPPTDLSDMSWPKSEIDQYVLATLDDHGLSPADRATKETLIRRVSFDLTGLPPTLAEIDTYIADDREDAYERLVDRLLSSPAYGERMAADWMDVARYADSDGYLDDKHRDFHPYRNWVIGAFNDNMPYDQFITYQMAGDMMPGATKESTLATAFNRLHKKNSEAGIVYEEYRVEYVADRTNTLGKGILGLSMECARCHDHKYDPISQKNYFELFAFFNSTHEMGSPVYGPDQVPGPAMLLTSIDQDVEIDKLQSWVNSLEEKLRETDNKTDEYSQWVATLSTADDIQKGINEVMIGSYSFDQVTETDQEDNYKSPNSVNNSLPASLKEPIFKEGRNGQAFYVSDYNRAQLGKQIGWYDRTDDFSFQLSIQPDTLYSEAGLLWHSEEKRLGLKGYSLHLADNKLRFIMAMSWPTNAIQVTTTDAVPTKEWSDITITYDGSSKAQGVAIYINGKKQELTTDYDNLYKSILFVPDIHTYGFSGIIVGARDKFIPFKNGGIDEIMVFDRELSSLEVLQLNRPDEITNIISNSHNHEDILRSHYDMVINPRSQTIKKELQTAREEENTLVSSIPEIMVMGDLPEPRPTYILERGAYDAHGEQVEPSTPEAVLAFDESYPKNRYGLSQWIFDQENPLTARVYVNRLWQMHFGKGIVKTSDDFGAQGSLPSHPALLDWLAIEFIESGWDIKAMHKKIVTSATYMQSSKVTETHLAKDPENILLSRGPRYRMPAEMIRDNALAVSGLLVDQQGGPSVYPYQPEGLWDGLTTKHWAYKYLQEEGDGLYRRSLYSIWKRAAPPPFMQIFDVDDRGDCEVDRRMSSTPLQALNLLNDPQFVEVSRVLAEKMIKTEPDSTQRLYKIFRLLTGRYPSETEQTILTEFYDEELANFQNDPAAAKAFMNNGYKDYDPTLTTEIAALGVVASSIMNTTEAFTKK